MARAAVWRLLAGAHPRRTAARAVLLVLAAWLLFGYVLMPVRGVGVSMQPTINPGDLLFINRVAYRFRPPRHGDIVAVRVAGESVVYVKRLLATPGERIAFVDGVLWRNGEPVTEPYVAHRAAWQLAEVTLGDDDYFVVGDNRGMPMAQHDFGTATRARLIGPRAF